MLNHLKADFPIVETDKKLTSRFSLGILKEIVKKKVFDGIIKYTNSITKIPAAAPKSSL